MDFKIESAYVQQPHILNNYVLLSYLAYYPLCIEHRLKLYLGLTIHES